MMSTQLAHIRTRYFRLTSKDFRTISSAKLEREAAGVQCSRQVNPSRRRKLGRGQSYPRVPCHNWISLLPPTRTVAPFWLELAGLFSSFFAAVLASSGEGTILYSSSSLKEAPCITYAYGSFLYFFSTLFCLDFMLSKGSKNVIYSKMPHDAGSILNKWDLSGISMIPRLSLKHTSTSLMEYPP